MRKWNCFDDMQTFEEVEPFFMRYRTRCRALDHWFERVLDAFQRARSPPSFIQFFSAWNIFSNMLLSGPNLVKPNNGILS